MNQEKNKIGRREFLAKSTLVAVAISMPVTISCKESNAADPVSNECSETTKDILGPYYKAGSPIRENIIPSENTAPPLLIKGIIFSDCDTEVKDALVEIWNANEDGEYDTSPNFKFRGSYKTSSDGHYRFETIYPGRYLNGSDYRPSHIHFRITAPNHQELVSQIYFKNDPYIPKDPWASDPNALERILVINKDTNDTDTVTFDIYLNRVS
jgi:protocatechuate 3,4-dioxygenase beta subunit